VFQLNWFLTKASPLGLNGPFSENAPTPREEQPGPSKQHEKKFNFSQNFKFFIYVSDENQCY